MLLDRDVCTRPYLMNVEHCIHETHSTKQVKNLSLTVQTSLNIQVFSNDSATRTFLALIPDGGSPEIVRLIKRVDRAMLRHRLQQFYSDPVPHVSLLWWNGDMQEAIKPHITALQQIWGSVVGSWCCQVRLVHRANLLM